MSNDIFLSVVAALDASKPPYVTATVTSGLNKESELKMKSLSVFIKKFVEDNNITRLVFKCSNVRISCKDFYNVIREIRGDGTLEEWLETVLQYHASLTMLNDQENSSVPVLYGFSCSCVIRGGPYIMWSFERTDSLTALSLSEQKDVHAVDIEPQQTTEQIEDARHQQRAQF